MARIELTQASHELFMDYAKDADNWSGNPWVSTGNVECGAKRRGNLADIIKKGLIETHEYDEGEYYVSFTKLGKMYAKANGVDTQYWD